MGSFERQERAAEKRAREAVGFATGRREAYYRAVRAKNGNVITRRRDEWERAVKRAEYAVAEHRAACIATDRAAARGYLVDRLRSAAVAAVVTFAACVPSLAFFGALA